ncbi:MAG: putative ABC transporter permease [Phycisphaerae bacterium]|nr:putative ABC transporter permease [Phycisphaerae bacterium]
MIYIALKMLLGNKGKFIGIVVGITFGALLISQQAAIFCGLMIRTYSQIKDIEEPDLWVMDPQVRFIDEFKPLNNNDLYRIRGVPGVEWGVRFYKGLARARTPEGAHQQISILGLDDETLAGAPTGMLLGNIEDLRRPGAVIMDDAGYSQIWPDQPLQVGHIFEMNDQRAILVGICKASRTFQTIPLIYTRYSEALRFSPQERQSLMYVLVKAQPGVNPEELCQRITAVTDLKALTRQQFAWNTMYYYMEKTGIPVNFGITVLIGLIVGTAISGQTFYLFTLDNLRQFALLKAIGTTNIRLVGMIMLQAAMTGFIGYGLGVGPAAFFGISVQGAQQLAFYMPWQVLAGTAVAVIIMLLFASVISIRRVLTVEPAIVFQT